MATLNIPAPNPHRDAMAGSPMDVAGGSPTAPRYDPAFSSPEADVVLASLEGILYRVPSFVLRSTCGMFRKLLGPSRRHSPRNRHQQALAQAQAPVQPQNSDDIPRASSPTPSTLSSISSLSSLPSPPVLVRNPGSATPPSSTHDGTSIQPSTPPPLLSPSPAYSFTNTHYGIHSSEQSPIIISHKDKIVSRVLRLLTGLETPRLQCFEELEQVLSLIEQFDAPGPLSVIQSSITSPFFMSDPLRLYGITTRFGWEEEAKLVSEKTLTYSLFDDENQAQLRQLSTKGLLALIALHRKRRDEFKSLVDTEDVFSAGNGGDDRVVCMGCGEMMDNHWWREYKARMFVEMDRRPLGDKILSLEGIEEWPEAVSCWNAKCGGGISGNGNGGRGCGRLYYDKVETLKDLKAILDRLPKTI